MIAEGVTPSAKIYRKHAAKLRGKTSVTSETVTEAAALGTELITILRPKSAKKGPKGGQAAVDAAGVRDRLWTLLVRDAEQQRRAGIWRWGERDVDAHVPLLYSHRANPTPKKAGPKAAPAAAPSATTP